MCARRFACLLLALCNLGWTACKLTVPGGGDGGVADGAVDAAAADVGPGTDGAPDAQPAGDAAPADAGPPFTCDPVAASSPVLDGIIAVDPLEPHPGDTVTVLVRSQSTDRPDAPPMDMVATSASGVTSWSTNAMAGGRAVYYYAISDVELGDYCLVGRIGGADEIATKLTVTPWPTHPPRCNGGIYKVTQNHQWTCSEQPEFGNEIYFHVLDENGAGVPNATVRIGWPDTTLRPLFNDTDPPAPSDVPATVQTDGSGTFHGWNYWPTNVNGYMVFNISVEGCASDVATELTTGWWETDNSGCRFCDPGFTNRNVWGHWSYTVTFQLDTGASQACRVDNDHAGQQGCTVEHIHHDPGHQACWNIP